MPVPTRRLVVAAIRATGSASSMGELLEAWFATAAVSWAPTTIRQTRSVIDRCLLPGLGPVRIGDVTPAMVDSPYSGLAENGGERGQGLSFCTLARANVVLRAALGQAVRWGWIWDNPALSAHRIVVPPREISPPTPAELGVLFDYLREKEPQLFVFVVLAAMTGARRAQVLGLRWENLNFESMRVSFRSGWVEGPDGPVLAPTKSKRSHVVDLDPATFAVLAELGQCRSGFVFSDDGGVTAWKPNRVTKAFIRCRRRAGLREFRCMTCAISWRRKCWRRGCRSRWCRNVWTIAGSPRLWFGTATLYRAVTRRHRQCCVS